MIQDEKKTVRENKFNSKPLKSVTLAQMKAEG